MSAYPLTIENGAGERVTFERRVDGPDGAYVVGEARVAPGAGPPMHVHYLQEEAFTVVRGRIGVQRPGEPPAYAGEGETVVFAAGEPHRFWNAGQGELHCTAYVRPAGNVEFFLGALFASQKANGGARPDLFDVAYLCRRYRTEYRMLEIPALVQTLGFPILVAVGKLLGKFRKYDGAPEPLRGPARRETGSRS